MTKRKRRRTRNSARLAKKRQDSERNVVDIFSSQVNYPTDVTVIGSTFEIPVHGIYLAAKSQSLCGILQQPSNENEKKWTLDTLVSKRVAILFLKHFYDGLNPVELDFSSLEISEYYSYLTLMKAHLGGNDFLIMCCTVTRVIMSKIDTIYSKHSLRKAILLLNIPNPPKEDVALFLSLFQMSHFFQLRTAFNPDSSNVDDISRHSRIMINIGKCIIHWSIYHSLPLNFEDLHFLIKNNKVKEDVKFGWYLALGSIYVALKQKKPWEEIPDGFLNSPGFTSKTFHKFYPLFDMMRSNNDFAANDMHRMIDKACQHIFLEKDMDGALRILFGPE